MISGIWKETVGSYHASYSTYELVQMFKGKVVITPDNRGSSATVESGDMFVFESDFKGSWKIEENVTKYFCFVL